MLELNHSEGSSDTSIDEDDSSTNNSKHDFKVTPWEVEGEIDYNKLIAQFGTQPITSEIIERIKQVTGEVHPMLK
ncbi:MAG: hypothetical protein M3Y53_04380, partial [Thermoproteota archaeon]|nr:hypothetical protein [Thermoproteota archaeon]